MAVRLNVVMIQTPPATVNAQRVAEKIVGELIGVPAMDLILVGPLNQIDPASTDYLTLHSLTGDVALLDWNLPEASLTSLYGLGIDGSRTPHPGDPNANGEQSSARRFYLFDLNRYSDGGEVCTALGDLLNSRRVRTFSLAVAGPPRQSPSKEAETKPPQRRATSETSEAAKATETADTSTPKPKPERLSSLDLDDLVDQLDSLDP